MLVLTFVKDLAAEVESRRRYRAKCVAQHMAELSVVEETHPRSTGADAMPADLATTSARWVRLHGLALLAGDAEAAVAAMGELEHVRQLHRADETNEFAGQR
eukprot:SAG31_NODE_28300_length_412_cov_0.658147_1_plen_101_part_10